MSVLKTVGVIGAISGVGLIGYYLFNKYKPTLAQTQAEELKGQQYVIREDKPEYRKLWSIVAQYGYDNLGKNQAYLDLKNQLLTQNPLIITDNDYINLSRFYEDINTKGVGERILGKELYNLDNSKYWWEKRFQGIEDESFKSDKFGKGLAYQTNCEYNPSKGEKNPCAYNYSKPFPFPFNINQSGDKAYKQWLFEYYLKYAVNESNNYFWKTPDPSGQDISLVASDCVQLDKDMKRLIDRIAEQTRTAPNENHRRVLVWYKDILEDAFQLHSCRDKIEKQRLLDMAKIQTLGAITQEKSVLGASEKNQNIYLGVGALVLVLSAGILASGGGSTASNTQSISSSGILGNIVIIGGLTGMGYLIFKKPKVVLPKT